MSWPTLGFQKSYPFRGFVEEDSIDLPSTYKDSLFIIPKAIHMVVRSCLPTKPFRISFLPSEWSQTGWAGAEFRTYMLTLLAEERNQIAEGKPGRGTRMSNLVRASSVQSQATDAATKQHTISVSRANELKPLTVDEILGHVFVFDICRTRYNRDFPGV